jgi:cytidylate kinase
LRLRFIAPREARIGHFIKARQMTPAEAKSYVERKDAHRAGFIKKYFKADADDPTDFDLIVNTAELGIERAFTAVAAVIRQRITAKEIKRTSPRR